MITSSMNLHGVETIKARIAQTEGTQWITFEFRAEDGGRFELSTFSDNPEELLARIVPAGPIGFNAGIKAAADLLDKKADEYDAEHGNTDPETGTREYPGRGAGEDYYNSLRELADDIRALLERVTA